MKNKSLGTVIYPLVCVFSLVLLPLQPHAEPARFAEDAYTALLALIAPPARG